MIIKCPSCGNIESIDFIDRDGDIFLEKEYGWAIQRYICRKCGFNFRATFVFDIKIKNIEYEEWGD